MTIRPLLQSDVSGALDLCTAANWNQTAADWERMLALQPDGCWCVERDGRVVATASLVRWGTSLGWIGMVLTAPDQRGQGLARALMNHAIATARAWRIPSVWLDATDMGIALYRSLGFVYECAIERFHRDADTIVGSEAWPTFIPDWKLDEEATGIDRRRLLESLAMVEATSLPGGFVMGRPGARATYCGPLVARTSTTAELLLTTFLLRHQNQPVYIDCLPSNTASVDMVQRYGFRPVRRLTRMSLALESMPYSTGDRNLVYGIAGFEYG
ncbi:MAG: GNAT family N-acetyltransferase [Bryobacteraceae bacterium]